MTKQDVLNIGFTEIHHFTIRGNLIYDLGRNRHLSLACLGTPNEMLFLIEINDAFSKEVKDIITIRNYDYDGYLKLSDLTDLITAITGKRNNNSNIYQ
jgi:galactitol-specific phosphotransferase system IIC component